MELQFNKSQVKSLGSALRGVKNGELTQEIRLTDGLPDIGRVLTAWGQIILKSKEWQGGEIGVSGGVMVWVLYVPEDGTEVRCVEGYLPFQLKWELDRETPEGPVRIAPLLRFVDGRGTSARKIMLRVGIAALAEGLYESQAEVCRPGELPEDVQLLKHTYPLWLPKEAGEKTFQLDEDVQIPDSAAPVEKLLSYTVLPEVTDKKVMANKVVFKGSVNLHIVYRCPEGRVRNLNREIPFSQFAELNESYGSDARADIQTAVTSLEVGTEAPGKLRVKCGLVGQYRIDDRELLELTEDAFSPFRELLPIRDDLELPVILDDRTEFVDAQQLVPGQEGEAVDVNFLPDFPRLRQNEDTTELEIPALFQVLYYSGDGTLQSHNARWEGRVSIPGDENSLVTANVCRQGRAQAMPTMEGISLSGQIRLQLSTTARQGMEMICGLELGTLREPDPARPTLVLLRSCGESLWEIAKRVGSTVETIQAANGLTGEPEAQRMLLVPVK